jgi:hypothetical protein
VAKTRLNTKAFKKSVRRSLTKRATNLTKALKAALVTNDMVVTGKLHDSIKTRSYVDGDNKIGIRVYMENYGKIINDRGGDGGKNRKWLPPLNPIYQWVKHRGLQPKEAKDRRRKNPQLWLAKSIQWAMKEKGFMANNKGKRDWATEVIEMHAKKLRRQLAVHHVNEVNERVGLMLKNALKTDKKK